MADHRTAPGTAAGEIVDVAEQAAGDQDRGGRLEAIEDQRCNSERLAPGAEHIGRTDVAGSDLADVALAAGPGEQQSEGNRAEDIPDRQ